MRKYFYGRVISLTCINSQCDRKRACNYQSFQPDPGILGKPASFAQPGHWNGNILITTIRQSVCYLVSE